MRIPTLLQREQMQPGSASTSDSPRFPLLRYFLVASVVAIGVASVAMGSLFVRTARANFTREAEARSVNEGYHFSEVFYHDIWSPFGQYAGSVGAVESSTYAEFARVISFGLNIVRLSVLDTDGRVVFSTDLGATAGLAELAALASSAQRQTAASTLRRGERISVDGVEQLLDVVIVFVPLRDVAPSAGTEGQVVGTLEVTRDITDALDQSERVTLQTAITGSLATGGVLVLVLFAIMVRADRAIGLGYRDLVDQRGRSEESERRYRDLFDEAPVAYFNLLPDGTISECNGAAATLLRERVEDLVGRSVLDLYASGAAGRERMVELLAHLSAGEQRDIDEIQMLRADGSTMWVTSRLRPVKNDKGIVIESRSMVIDITGRREAEVALRASDERLRTIIEGAHVSIYAVDGTGRITTVEGQLLEGLGLDASSTGKQLSEVFARVPRMVEENDRALAGTPITSVFGVDHRTFEVRISPVLDQPGSVIGAIGVISEVSERVELENRLVRSDKLAAIGTLVSGVAHEVNNPLSGVLGRVDLMLREDLGETVLEDLRVVRQEALRAVAVMRNLLAFAREAPSEKGLASIQSILSQTIDLCRYEMNVNNIEVVTEFSPTLSQVMVNPSQLQQVFLNLIVNGQHAMADAHGRGTLTVHAADTDDAVEVVISDDGPGIPQEVLPRIFDPFFTTKKVGKGTGLGLSIAYGIVREHGGEIDVTSSPRVGTTFTVRIPKGSATTPNTTQVEDAL